MCASFQETESIVYFTQYILSSFEQLVLSALLCNTATGVNFRVRPHIHLNQDYEK